MVTLGSLTRIGALTGTVYMPKDVKYDEKGNIKSFIDTYHGSIDACYEGVLDSQNKGIIAKDANVPIEKLTDGQKRYLADKYDIDDMAGQEQKNALLNELIAMGVVTADEAVRSTYVAYTNINTSLTYVTEKRGLIRGLAVSHSLYPPVSIYENANLIDFVRASLENDIFYSTSQRTVDAKNHLLAILDDVFSSKADG